MIFDSLSNVYCINVSFGAASSRIIKKPEFKNFQCPYLYIDYRFHRITTFLIFFPFVRLIMMSNHEKRSLDREICGLHAGEKPFHS